MPLPAPVDRLVLVLVDRLVLVDVLLVEVLLPLPFVLVEVLVAVMRTVKPWSVSVSSSEGVSAGASPSQDILTKKTFPIGSVSPLHVLFW